jgi:hypothetical protein
MTDEELQDLSADLPVVIASATTGPDGTWFEVVSLRSGRRWDFDRDGNPRLPGTPKYVRDAARIALDRLDARLARYG